MGGCASITSSKDVVSYSMTVEKLSANLHSTERYMCKRPTDAEDVGMVDNLGGWCMVGDHSELTEAFRTDEKYKSLVDMITTNGGTPLVLAAYAGALDCCKTLFSHGAKVDTLCLQGTSPLYSAAQQNHIHIVEWLIQEGATVDLINKMDDENVTALHIAALHGRPEICELLIAKGADPSRKKLGGATSLWLAAQEGHLEVVTNLARKHRCSATEPRDDGKPPVFIAAQRGHDDVIRFLVSEMQVPLGAIPETALTPLHAASMFGHYATCDLLCNLVPLEKRTEFVNAETVDGYTAVELRETHALDASEGVQAVLLHNDAVDRPAAKEEEKLMPRSYKATTLEEPIVYGDGSDEKGRGDGKGKQHPSVTNSQHNDGANYDSQHRPSSSNRLEKPEKTPNEVEEPTPEPPHAATEPAVVVLQPIVVAQQPAHPAETYEAPQEAAEYVAPQPVEVANEYSAPEGPPRVDEEEDA